MWPAKGEGVPGGVLLPLGVGLPPFPSWIRTWEGEGVAEKKEGGAPPPLSLSYSDWRGEGRAAQPLPPLLSST